jgi:hypothetical protein
VDPLGDDDGSGDPGESDPDSPDPGMPSVGTDGDDAVEIDSDADEIDSDADEEVIRTFYGAVISLNVAMAAVPLGLMLIHFRGDWELGGLAVLVGLVAALATYRFYYVFRRGRRSGEGKAA